MRYEFLMVPVAIFASAQAAADSYLTVPEAQAAIFPGAKFTPADVTLTEAQVNQLIQETQGVVFHSKVKMWRVSTGGWFFIDQVMGRDDIVTYAVGLDDHGAFVGAEVMVCNPSYDGVRDQKWLARFKGKQRATAADLGNEIPVVTGATLSSNHLTEGIKRVLTTYALFIAPKSG
jgi:hypothetical protein